MRMRVVAAVLAAVLGLAIFAGCKGTFTVGGQIDDDEKNVNELLTIDDNR